MTKLTLLAVLGLIYIVVLRLAYFILSAFVILCCGMSVWQLIRTSGNQRETLSPRS
jgi:predicted small integral membrane protein